MISFTLEELSCLCEGKIYKGASPAPEASSMVVSTVSTSSKEAMNALFIPLIGERFNAHDFILDAIINCASCYASSLPFDEVVKRLKARGAKDSEIEHLKTIPYILCSDTQRLLGLAGMLVRRKCKAAVCAITGSCGKTTVKEMTASILNCKGKTLFTLGNYNNDIGVPLTLLRLDESFDYAVIEQGASHLEDIARTCEFVEASCALITNVGEAHILGFGSRENVYHGKSEILDAVFSRGGIGIVPSDSPWFASWQKDYADALGSGTLLSFGESENATMQVSEIFEKSAGFITCRLTSHDARYPFDEHITLHTLGRHNAINAAGAALLALAMGASSHDVIEGLNAYRSMQGRLSAQHFDKYNLTVIDDAYNASVNAVLAAIDTLKAQDGYRIFVFGDMGELGSEEDALHAKVGNYAKDKVDMLLCIGPLAQFSVEAMGHNALHFAKHEDLIVFLKNVIERHQESGVTCLIKGSHAMHMDKIVNALTEYGMRA